jgi:hypothetical protein
MPMLHGAYDLGGGRAEREGIEMLRKTVSLILFLVVLLCSLSVVSSLFAQGVSF